MLILLWAYPEANLKDLAFKYFKIIMLINSYCCGRKVHRCQTNLNAFDVKVCRRMNGPNDEHCVINTST